MSNLLPEWKFMLKEHWSPRTGKSAQIVILKSNILTFAFLPYLLCQKKSD